MIDIIKKSRGIVGLKRFSAEQDGIAAVEFGLLGSLFIALILGAFDLGYTAYTRAVLKGALEEAGRTASLENTTTANIDARISKQVNSLNGQPNITVTRKYYENYDDVRLPEDFTDGNNNGIKDSNECFVDRNGNKQWDADVGVSGRGGAQDVVAFTATMEFERPFPLFNFTGQTNQQTLTATTYLRNQPFSAQAGRTGVNICPAT
jgi:Flp pilus assembly pilin Flp